MLLVGLWSSPAFAASRADLIVVSIFLVGPMAFVCLLLMRVFFQSHFPSDANVLPASTILRFARALKLSAIEALAGVFGPLSLHFELASQGISFPGQEIAFAILGMVFVGFLSVSENRRIIVRYRQQKPELVIPWQWEYASVVAAVPAMGYFILGSL